MSGGGGVSGGGVRGGVRGGGAGPEPRQAARGSKDEDLRAGRREGGWRGRSEAADGAREVRDG